MKQLFFLLTATLLCFASCKKKDDPYPGGAYTGSTHAMGKGKVTSWTKTDANGNPAAIGFTFDDAALTGLPATSPGGGHSHDNVFELSLPGQAAKTPFKQIVIDWNPQGHPPMQFYGAAHFDFHFYTVAESERNAIPPYEADSSGFLQFPHPDYLPAGYFNPGGGAPQMGAHWLDMNAPELRGQPFTETFIYGSFAGKVNFLEPMIAMDFLKSITNFSRSIPRPARVRESGYYPTRFRITHANGQYRVSFEDMEYRTGS